MELKEQEKFLKIKKEVIKIIKNKRDKLEINNIKAEIVTDKEYNYIVNFESDKAVAQLIVKIPDFAPYYYVCFNILWLNDDVYWWFDEENSRVQDIVENITNSLDYYISSIKDN